MNGLFEPITVLDGMILDGRNRLLVCKELGIEPDTREFAGSDPVSFVIGMNLHRRHLDESQRSIVAGKLANMPSHRPEKGANLHTSASEAATLLNVSERRGGDGDPED